MAALIHMHKFPLETEYGAVIGYVKRLVSMWKEVRKITTDETGIGDVVTEDMRNEGIQFSHPSGTHDDQLWALALACHGLREESRVPEYHPVVLTGYIIKPRIPYFTFGKEPWKRDPLYNQTARLCMACGARRPLTMPYCPKCGSGSDGPNPAFVKP